MERSASLDYNADLYGYKYASLLDAVEDTPKAFMSWFKSCVECLASGIYD